jgi:hypothetical protein
MGDTLYQHRTLINKTLPAEKICAALTKTTTHKTEGRSHSATTLGITACYAGLQPVRYRSHVVKNASNTAHMLNLQVVKMHYLTTEFTAVTSSFAYKLKLSKCLQFHTL